MSQFQNYSGKNQRQAKKLTTLMGPAESAFQ